LWRRVSADRYLSPVDRGGNLLGIREIVLLDDNTGPQGKYPPAEPGALDCEPLKAAIWGR
jgi:hypothetical protein